MDGTARSNGQFVYARRGGLVQARATVFPRVGALVLPWTLMTDDGANSG